MSASSTVSLVQVTGSNLTYAYIVLGISLGALAIAYALRARSWQLAMAPKMREIAKRFKKAQRHFFLVSSAPFLTLLESSSFFSTHFLVQLKSVSDVHLFLLERSFLP